MSEKPKIDWGAVLACIGCRMLREYEAPQHRCELVHDCSECGGSLEYFPLMTEIGEPPPIIIVVLKVRDQEYLAGGILRGAGGFQGALWNEWAYTSRSRATKDQERVLRDLGVGVGIRTETFFLVWGGGAE